MATTPDDTPNADEPGGASQPEGDGPVTLGDRTEPGGQGSPDTNQAKAEPMSPTPDHPEPPAAPELSDMNVGAGDPQAPSHPAALGRTPGIDPSPAGSLGTLSAGKAQRAPGSLGSVPAGESVETDLEAGAARMSTAGGPSSGHGDTGPAPDSGDAPIEGSSEDQQVVSGARLPKR